MTMTPSTRTQNAIKPALAVTIAYGISLGMGWENPYWAGFAVALISLSTAGQSFNKGAMRMLGTLVAGVAAAGELLGELGCQVSGHQPQLAGGVGEADGVFRLLSGNTKGDLHDQRY